MLEWLSDSSAPPFYFAYIPLSVSGRSVLEDERPRGKKEDGTQETRWGTEILIIEQCSISCSTLMKAAVGRERERERGR